MKIQFGAPGCVVGLVLVGALGMTSASSAAGRQSTPPPLKHAPVQLHRNPDGSPQRGLRNQFQHKLVRLCRRQLPDRGQNTPRPA